MTLKLPDFPARTLGGMQWWSDRLITPDALRIQQHVVTGHHRLLDRYEYRRASGDWQHCLAQLIRRRSTARPAEQAVLLMHGLGRSRGSMEPLAHRLRDAGYDAFNLGYASTRDTIDQHARTASEVVNRLGDYRLTHFVGHSMGNLVLRRMFARFGDRGRSWGRAVMLGPPNLGSKLAAALHRTPLAGNVLRRVMGRSALRLATWDDPHDFAGVKGMPVEVGVIAGRFERIPNPIIGEGDFIVGVEETRLDGAQHLTLPGHHTLLMRDTAAVEQTLHFLAEGRFAST